MARRFKSERRSTPGWMTTFGDMNNLLLTFFVALLTDAVIQGYEMRLILSPFMGSLGVQTGGNTLSKGRLAEMGYYMESLPSREIGRGMSKIVEEIREIFKPEIKTRKVKVEETMWGIKVTLAEDVYFDSGSASIKPEMLPTIRKFADLLQNLTKTRKDIRVDVIGHTDDRPTTGTLYPSNWELSTARACSVVRALMDFGVDPTILKASGKAQYDPVEDNSTPEGRAFNRRTEIYIYRESLVK